MQKIVAIDGPSGSGKSTLAKGLAKRLSWIYVDTGAMYRAFTWLCLKEAVDSKDMGSVKKLLEGMDICFENTKDGQKVYITGHDVTEAIRSIDVTSNVSAFAAIKDVRERITEIIREMGDKGSIILDGRDIGTVVFPNAGVKIFLVADSETRAKRRMEEMKEETTLADVKASIEKRDAVDSSRENAPLIKADDAIELSTAGCTVEETAEKAFALVSKVLR